MHNPWQPTLGAVPEEGGVRFRVWAPTATAVEVVPEGPRSGASPAALPKQADGYFTALQAGWRAGDRYRYRIDGRGPFPDPASRAQPLGVHGSSEVIDARAFAWSDQGWPGVTMDKLVIYELHIGAFTPAGTFAGVVERLPYLVELGVNALELMPVADFPGRRNWGYDGVNLFAPARCYGTPDELRRLVNEAHRLGLAVLLDVVYNHLGPDGNYLSQFSPFYFNSAHHTPWGAAVNFDGEHCGPVRDVFVENALHWLCEYHFDGLRLDATDAIIDEGEKHFLIELAERVHQAIPERQVVLIAEDVRNNAAMIRSRAEGGWGLDGVWADDFHHGVRRCLAGDSEGYYRDYTGSTADIAATLRKGWFYCGENSLHRGGPRGTDPAGLPPSRFVICIQNHDQVGNRAFGERLNHQIDPAAYRAAIALLLCAPQTPLLFMGQEWSATSPFRFFTDHHEELGKLVTAGRRNEFKHFAAFADEAQRERIPDPQAETTFLTSRIDWSEPLREPHAGTLRLYRDLLRLRCAEAALHSGRHEASSPVDGAVVTRREGTDGSVILIVVALKPNVRVTLPTEDGTTWTKLLSTDDPAYTPQPRRRCRSTCRPSRFRLNSAIPARPWSCGRLLSFSRDAKSSGAEP